MIKRADTVFYSDVDALDACNRAASIIKSAGFALSYTSMQSEACYYVLPGYAPAIRIATHKIGRSESHIGLGSVASCITFGTNQGPFTDIKVRHSVWEAMGKYFMDRLMSEASAEHP